MFTAKWSFNLHLVISPCNTSTICLQCSCSPNRTKEVHEARLGVVTRPQMTLSKMGDASWLKCGQREGDSGLADVHKLVHYIFSFIISVCFAGFLYAWGLCVFLYMYDSCATEYIRNYIRVGINAYYIWPPVPEVVYVTHISSLRVPWNV